MCRACRYIDPGPSFVFIGPPPSATRLVAAGRRLARPPLPAIRDLDRAPPPAPQALGRHPLAPGRHPPSARPPPLATGRAQQAGEGGGRQDTPVMASARRKNESADFGSLKIDPQKSTRLQFLHQKVRRLFLGRY